MCVPAPVRLTIYLVVFVLLFLAKVDVKDLKKPPSMQDEEAGL